MESIQPQTREKAPLDRVATLLIVLWIAMVVAAIVFASGVGF